MSFYWINAGTTGKYKYVKFPFQIGEKKLNLIVHPMSFPYVNAEAMRKFNVKK